MLELDGDAEAFAPGVFYVALVGAVVLWRCRKAPSIEGVVRPCATFVGLFVDLHFETHRGEQHLVVVKWAVHVGVSGDDCRGV